MSDELDRRCLENVERFFSQFADNTRDDDDPYATIWTGDPVDAALGIVAEPPTSLAELRMLRQFVFFHTAAVVGDINAFARATGSPIERLLLYALGIETISNCAQCFIVHHGDETSSFGFYPSFFRTECFLQHPVGAYALDFLIERYTWEDGQERRYARFAVECDGHDFHEKTKEQARHDKQRDRAIQGTGLHILRFTGSEIFADPFKCATEVLRFRNK